MALDKEQISHIAALARLSLSDTERESFGGQLSSILEYVAVLSKAETAGVEPMAHSIEVHNVLRDDEIVECGERTRTGLVKSFPERSDEDEL